MKRYFSLLTLVLLAVVSCKKNGPAEEEYVVDDPASYIGVKVAPISGDLWEDGEKVNVNGLLSLPFDSSDTTLTFKVKNTANAPFYVAWPHNAVAEYTKGAANVEVPVSQTAEDESLSIYLGQAASGEVKLHNCLCKVTIQSSTQYDLRKVSLTSAGGLPIAGVFTTDYQSLTPAKYGSSDYVTLTSEGGFTFPCSFYIVPGDYTSDGFKITYTDVDNVAREDILIPEKAYVADGIYNLELGSKPVSSKLLVSFSDAALKWHEGDQVSLNGKASEVLGKEYEGVKVAEFKTTPDESPYCVAFPKDAVSGCQNGYAYVSVPKLQDYDNPSAPYYLGRADDASVTLTAPYCTLELTAEEALTAESIKIQSLDGLKMSGTFLTDYWSLRSETGDAYDYVILSKESGEGFSLPAKIVLAPGKYSSKGLSIKVKVSDTQTDEFVVFPTQEMLAGQSYTMEIKNKPRPKWYIEVKSLTSSSVVLSWTTEDPDQDHSKAYKVCVYEDEACTTAVSTYNIPANAGCWKSSIEGCNFSVGHLKSGKDYWFKVSTDELESEPATIKTADFTIVPMVGSISSTGVVFAENFSEYAWADDYIYSAGGYIPSDKSSFLNENTSGAKFTYEELESQSGFRISAYDQAIASSRLAGWLSEGKIYMHPGYLKLGTSSTYGFVLTPKFNVASGKTITVDVTITASRVNTTQNATWSVAVVSKDGDKGGRESDFTWPDVTDQTLYQEITITNTGASWQSATASGLKIKSGDRIEFGRTKSGSNSKARVLISGISVNVTSIE